MSQSFGCKCNVKDKVNWRVLDRNINYSYFESPRGAPHYSAYSTVICTKCKQMGRTKAKYVDDLKGISREQWYLVLVCVL